MPRSIEEWAKERNRDRSGGSVGSSIVGAVGGQPKDVSVAGSIVGAVGGQSGGSVGGSIAGAVQQQTGQSGGQGSPRSIEEWAQDQQGSRQQSLDEGQRLYEQRKQAQAEAQPWKPTLLWLGEMSNQAEQARLGQQIHPQENATTWEDVKDAWEASRAANRAADYAGRDKLIKEYNAARHEMGAQRHTPEPDVQRRYEQARDRLYEQERIHGNIGLNANGELQTMSYSFGEGVGNVIGGAMGRVIGGVGSAATWLGEAAARSEYAKSAAQLREMAAFYAMTGNENASEGASRMADTLTQRAAQRGNLEEFGGAYSFFDKQTAAGNRLVQAAKENQRPVVQMGVDVGSTAMEMGFDAVSGSPLVSMGVRVFGGSSQEAREAGAGFLQQGAYGAASASIEVMTEMIGGLKLYGGGQLDEVLEPALREIAGTPGGYALLRAMYTMVQEGNEEVLSDLLQPLAQSIYNGQSVGENYSQLELQDILYDWLLGAASAFGGAVVESGGYAQDYTAMREMQQDLNAQGVETGRMTDEQLRQAYTLDKAGVNVAGLQSAENRAVGGETIGEAYENMTPEQRQEAVVNMLTANARQVEQTPTDEITRETAQEILRESLGEREAESAERILDLGSERNLREQAIAYHTIATEYGQTEGRIVEDAMRSNVRGALNDAQVQHAYAYGESLRKSGQTVGVSGQVTEQGAQTAKPVRRAGLVTAGTFADGSTTYKAADLSKADARDLRILNDIAKAQGVDFVLYESELGEADAEGRRRYIGANGAYRNGVVYLDINAGLSGERTEGGKTYSIGQRALLVTAAHELTHHLEHSNPTMYRQLRSFVSERLGGSDSYIGYVKDAMARENIGVEAASREVVARACEEVLLDEDAIRELQGKKPTLWEQIKEWVKEFVAKFQSASGEAVEMRQYANELRRLWLDTAAQSAEIKETVLQAAPVAAASEANASPEAVQLSVRSDVTQGLNFRDASGELLERVFDGTKKYETRAYTDGKTNGKLPGAYLNKPIGIIQTGSGKAKLVGYWELGNGVLRDSKWLSEHRAELGNDGTEFEAAPGEKKWVYPIKWAERTDPVEVTSHGIRARDISDIALGSKNAAAEAAYTGEITQYSLRGVEPVEPKSDAWKRGFTAEEVRLEYPGFRKSDAKNEYVEDSGKSYEDRKAERIRLAQREKAGKRGNGTQRANTAPTYDRLYDTLEHEGFNGTILDASSGLGIGTDHGIQRGFDVEDIEPFYGEGYRPIFSDYSRLNKQYDVVISSAVINVLTQDDSDAMVTAIGKALKPGGRAFITVRSASSVDGSLKGGESKRLSQSAHEWVVPGSDNYQRGFETAELKAYLEDVLGPEYTVESSPKFYDKNTGKWQKWGDTSAVVTRNTNAEDAQRSVRDQEYSDAVARGDMEKAQQMVDAAAKASGYTTLVYRGGGEAHNVFDTNRGAGTTQYGAGTYFTDAYGLAQDWAKERAHTEDGDGFVGKYYINTADMFIDKSVDTSTPQWNNVKAILRSLGVSDKKIRYAENWGFAGIANALQSVGQIDDGRYASFDWKNAQKVNDILRQAGYKGIIGDFYDSKQYIVFDSSLAKSADPVTYDDNGDVIPLSQRFDSERNDIRFSVRSEAMTDREILMLAAEEYGEEAELTEFRQAMTEYQNYDEAAQAHLQKLGELQQERKTVTDMRTSTGEITPQEKQQRLDALDKQIASERGKASRAEKNAADALSRVTQLEKGRALQDILVKERAAQRQRTRAQANESTRRRDTRRKVEKLAKELQRRVAKPSEKRYIPADLMRQTVDVLQAINLDSSRPGTKSGEALRARLLEMQERYRTLETDETYKGASYDPTVAEMLKNMVQTVGDTPINKMTAAQLESVYNTLRAMTHVIQTGIKVKIAGEERDAWEVAHDMTRETRSVNKPKDSLISGWVNTQLSAQRMFRRLGNYTKNSAWEKVYRMLNDGQLKMTLIQMEGAQIFADLIGKENEKAYRELNSYKDKDLVDVGLTDGDGKSIKISHGMMVSLYMHLLNEQNARHVARGGLTIPDLKGYYTGADDRGFGSGERRAVGISAELAEARREQADAEDELREAKQSGDAEAIQQAEDAVDAAKANVDEILAKGDAYLDSLRESIEKQLTDYERKWIEATQELMDGYSKDRLNETTLEVYGIKKARVDHYFPIKSDRNFTRGDFEAVSRNMSLENVGFMKERVEGTNPMYLMDVADVVNTQISNVAQYCGLMPAIRSFNKIWNKSEAGNTVSLKDTVNQKFGQGGLKYVENLIADLQGARRGKSDGLSRFLSGMRGNMAGANLTISLNTALAQAASYPTAAAEIGWTPLIKAFFKGGQSGRVISRADRELIAKYTPLLWTRLQGYSTVELGDLAGNNQLAGRVFRKMRFITGWIQAMDTATVGRLWYAAQYYVDAKNPELQKGSDEYYKETAKVFNDIVEKTQPDYTTMQRPDILRNPNELVRSLTMFMTQRLQNFNLVYDAVATAQKYRQDYRNGQANGVTAEDVKQAQHEARRAVVSQIAAGATIVVFKTLSGILQHALDGYRDDDKELTEESISLACLDMFLDTMASNFLWGGELYDVIESAITGNRYYGLEVNGVQSISDILSTSQNLFSMLRDYKTLSWDKVQPKFITLAKKLGPMLGLPIGNAVKLFKGVWLWGQEFIHAAEDGDLLKAFDFEEGVERGAGIEAGRYVTAWLDGDRAKMREIIGGLSVNMTSFNSQLSSEIRGRYEDGSVNAAQAIRMLKELRGLSNLDAQDKLREWEFEKTQGYAYDKLKQTYLSGDVSEAQAMKFLRETGDKTQGEAERTMREWKFEKTHGYPYSDLKGRYVDGKVSQADTIRYVQEVTLKGLPDVQETVLHWQCLKDTGIDYDKIDERLQGGDITLDRAAGLWQKYGGMSQADATLKGNYVIACGASPGLKDKLTQDQYKGWYNYARAAGVKVEVYAEIRSTANTDEQSNINQPEAAAAITRALNSGQITRAQTEAVWKSINKGWTTTYAEYVAKHK
jgi:hypothetical protein